jgi:hypothetical protein
MSAPGVVWSIVLAVLLDGQDRKRSPAPARAWLAVLPAKKAGAPCSHRGLVKKCTRLREGLARSATATNYFITLNHFAARIAFHTAADAPARTMTAITRAIASKSPSS